MKTKMKRVIMRLSENLKLIYRFVKDNESLKLFIEIFLSILSEKLLDLIITLVLSH